MYYLNQHIDCHRIADSMAIVALNHIKHVYSSISYQWVINHEYDRHGHESPSRYGPLCSTTRKGRRQNPSVASGDFLQRMTNIGW